MIDIHAQALLGSIPFGTVRVKPTTPFLARTLRLGVAASSKLVFPPRWVKGCPAAPSIIKIQYFIGVSCHGEATQIYLSHRKPEAKFLLDQIE
jgi:hypothetical protein